MDTQISETDVKGLFSRLSDFATQIIQDGEINFKVVKYEAQDEGEEKRVGYLIYLDANDTDHLVNLYMDQKEKVLRFSLTDQETGKIRASDATIVDYIQGIKEIPDITRTVFIKLIEMIQKIVIDDLKEQGEPL